jgi:membrane-associated protease RseP (regulator of RpoE activity)
MRWEFGGAVVNLLRAFVAIIFLFFAAVLSPMADAQQNAGASSPAKGHFGAKFVTVTRELARERHLPPIGAIVTEVSEDGAAAKANIVTGDLIQAINDNPVPHAEDVESVLDPLSHGAEIRVTLLHGGQIVETRMTLLQPPTPPTTVVTGDPVLMLDTGGHIALIGSVVFTRDGQHLVSAGDDGVVRIWDVKSDKTVRTVRGDIGVGNVQTGRRFEATLYRTT